MSRKMLTHLDMTKNELQNAVAQNLAGAPASPIKGQFYYNSTDNTLYWWDGAIWQAAKSGAATSLGPVVPEPSFGSASADGTATTVSRSDHKHGNPTHVGADHAAISLSALAAPTGPLSMAGFKITNLPTSFVGMAATDAASKGYVDSVAQGLDPKPSVRVATTANITLSGTQTIDGMPVVDGDKVLVKNQTNPAQNGLYFASPTAWTRLVEMDTWGEVPGAYTWVEMGSTQADTGWVCTSDTGGTIDTTAITWTQFGGAGTIQPGAGLAQAGNVFNIGEGNGVNVLADTIEVEFGGTGAANQVARSDHAHSGDVPNTRSINTTPPLQGGGNLTTDRTLSIDVFTAAVKGAVPPPTTATGKFLKDDATWAAVPLDTTAGDARYARKYAVDVGGATSQVVTHNLNTLDVVVQVYRKAAPNDQVECDVEHTSVNTVTLRFTTAPTAAEHRAVVTG